MVQPTLAETPVNIHSDYTGNIGYTVTGGSFRASENEGDSCSVTNRSSASLSDIPQNSKIEKARLYWAGSNQRSDYEISLNNTLVSTNNNSGREYTNRLTEYRGVFSGAADVTDIVNQTGNGTYTVKGLSIDYGARYCEPEIVLGAWALLVIYENDAEPQTNIHLFEGFQSFQRGSISFTRDIGDVPANANAQLTYIAWEGDMNLGTGIDEDTGQLFEETFSVGGSALASQSNPIDNPFNSRSNIQGGLTAYGLDIDQYDISNYLSAGDAQLSTSYASGQDWNLLSAEIISIASPTHISTPDIALIKSLDVIKDPVSGEKSDSVFPKAIPGSLVRYTIQAVNNGLGKADTDTLSIVEQIPENAELSIAALSCSNLDSPVCFIEGSDSNSSGLTFNYIGLDSTSDDLEFSVDGTDYSYTPIDNAEGYDPNIRYFRMNLKGSFNSSDSTQGIAPEFSIQYQVRLQ